MRDRADELEQRLAGSPRTRFWLELFGNSAQFPIANALLELLTSGPAAYLREPDLYVIAAACAWQALWLSRLPEGARWRRVPGNLAGPASYTAVEALLEGPAFFAQPNHLAYWAFGAAVGALQAWQRGAGVRAREALVAAESVVRSSILFFMYAVFEMQADGEASFAAAKFFGDRTHVFIGLAVLVLGLSSGLASVTGNRYLRLLRETGARLRVYSEWLLGRSLLHASFVDPAALAQVRRERTVLFMDVRGFTRWSETQPPEAVVRLLDGYYEAAERVLAAHETVKRKFSADEVMAVFASPREALAAARELQPAVSAHLDPLGLGAGAGIHCGPVVEGLMGSAALKFFDVIGDTVNTAKRIEGAAGRGEILVSQSVMDALGAGAPRARSREISVKGKEGLLAAYDLSEPSAATPPGS